MVDAVSSTLSGLSNATRKLAVSAEKIANVSTEGSNTNLIQETVNVLLAKAEYKANLLALRVEQDMSDELGRLFDERA